jgi:hypothetical protein
MADTPIFDELTALRHTPGSSGETVVPTRHGHAERAQDGYPRGRVVLSFERGTGKPRHAWRGD